MPAEATTFVVSVEPVRAWADATVVAAGGRVYTGGPKDGVALPQLTVARLGGPDDAAGFTFGAWADTEADAASLAAELCTQLERIAGYAHTAARLIAGAVDTVRWQPDPETDSPRYIVDATIVMAPPAA